MYKKRVILILIFFIVFLSSNNWVVNALNTGFSTSELSREEKNTIKSNMDILFLEKEPPKQGIDCFDVNEDGLIAISQTGLDRENICVYLSDGTYLYGYSFDCSQNLAVEWDGEFLNVFFVRSDIIISLDSNGKILDIKKVQNTINNNIHKNDFLYSSYRTSGHKEYIIKNDMGFLNCVATSYSQIIVIDESGAERIIYDINSKQLVFTVLISCFSFGLVVITLIVIMTNIKKWTDQSDNLACNISTNQMNGSITEGRIGDGSVSCARKP